MTEPVEPIMPPGMGAVDDKNKLWVQDGKLVKNGGEKLIKCDMCACRPFTGYFMCIIEKQFMPYRDKSKYLNDPDFTVWNGSTTTQFYAMPAFVEQSYLIWPTMNIFDNYWTPERRTQPKVDLTKEIIYEIYNPWAEEFSPDYGEIHVIVRKISDFVEDYDEFLKIAFSKWKEGLPPYEPPIEIYSLWDDEVYGGIANNAYYTAWKPWLDDWMKENNRDVRFSYVDQVCTSQNTTQADEWPVLSNFSDDECVKAVRSVEKFKWLKDQNASYDENNDDPGQTNKKWGIDDTSAPANAKIIEIPEHINNDFSDFEDHLDDQWYHVIRSSARILKDVYSTMVPFDEIWTPVKAKVRWPTLEHAKITFDPEGIRKAVRESLPKLSENAKMMSSWPFMNEWLNAEEGLNTMKRRSSEWAKNFNWIDFLKWEPSYHNMHYLFSMPLSDKPSERTNKIPCRDGVVICHEGLAMTEVGGWTWATLSGDALEPTWHEGDINMNQGSNGIIYYSWNKRVNGVKMMLNRLPETPANAVGIKCKRVLSWYLDSYPNNMHEPEIFPDDLYAKTGKMMYEDSIGFLFGKTYDLPLSTYEGNTKLIMLSDKIYPPENPDDYGIYGPNIFPETSWRDMGFRSQHVYVLCNPEYIMDGDTDWTEEFLPDFHPIIKKGDVAPDPPKPPAKEIM